VSILGRSSAFVVALALAWSGTPGVARADATLRWKFRQGESLHYRLQHFVDVANSLDGRTTTTQTIDMTWRFTAVYDDGSCTMTQTVDRVRLVISGPNGLIEYDSARERQPRAHYMLDMFAPSCEMLVGMEISLKMDPQGRIGSVRLPREFSLPEGNSLLQLTRMRWVERMLLQCAFVLPEQPVALDSRWNAQTQVDQPALNLAVDSELSYRGPETRRGREFEKLDVRSVARIAGGTRAVERGAEQIQNGTGTLYFDGAAGRLHWATVEHAVPAPDPKRRSGVRASLQSVHLRFIPDVDQGG
jgi:hypothetical protein